MVDISQGMDAAAMYEFDMNGVIVFRNALAPEHVAHLNELLGERESDALSPIDADEEKKYSSLESARYSGKARFPEHPAFLELMAYKPAIDILRVMLGDWFRLDHAYGIDMDPVAPGEDVTEAATGNNLHGGNRMAMGEHQYHWHQGRMYNGLLVAMYALKDVNPGDGGFICVPGCARRRPARLAPPRP